MWFKVNDREYNVVFIYPELKEVVVGDNTHRQQVRDKKGNLNIKAILSFEEQSFEGKVRCHAEDPYDKIKGRKLAFARALKAANLDKATRSQLWTQYKAHLLYQPRNKRKA